MVIQGIPTRFKGVNFRSRLEAKWAHVFDQFGWEWAYEPFDLEGWIPDFLIRCKGDADLLVDIKPLSRYTAKPVDIIEKMEEAVAASPEWYNLAVLGIEPDREFTIGWLHLGNWWDTAIFSTPDHHPEYVGICQTASDWTDPISGEHTHGSAWPETERRVVAAFRGALNRVQWNAKEPRHIADVLGEFRL